MDEVKQRGLKTMATNQELIKVTCARCNGTGQFSFNLLDGDVCYGCNGAKFVLKTQAQINQAKYAAKAQAKKKEALAQQQEESLKANKELEEKTLSALRVMYKEFSEVKTRIDALLANDIHPDYKNQAILELVVKLAIEKDYSPSDNPGFHKNAYRATCYLRLMLKAGK
jgi:hypothetical protein